MKKHEELLEKHSKKFDELPLFFEGHSRILRKTDMPDFLISTLKPTIFSLEANGPIELPGIDVPRTKLNALFSEHLHRLGIRTSTICTKDRWILHSKENVPPIEIVVKGALIGSPKHIYKQIDKHSTRFGKNLEIGGQHVPYVRFDWRNPLPHADQCMPEGLADHFIDIKEASATAIKAFQALKQILNPASLDLLDICFFMNAEGNVLCAEISTDNTNIVYTGQDSHLKTLFASKDKTQAIRKAESIIKLLGG